MLILRSEGISTVRHLRKDVDNMEDIQREYTVLFNAITDTESTLELLRRQLIATQQLAEELYISRYDVPPDSGAG